MSPSVNFCQGMSSGVRYLTRPRVKAVIEIGPTDMTACDNCSETIIGKHFKSFFKIFFFLIPGPLTSLALRLLQLCELHSSPFTVRVNNSPVRSGPIVS